MARLRHTMVLTTVLSVLGTSTSAQREAPPDHFATIAFMLGKWEGTAEGQPGKGNPRREYTRTLNGRFIRALNRVEYQPTEKRPQGEIHEDEGLFSFDRGRKRLVLRQFHVEGFVNQYVEDGDSWPERVVFATESIENIPAGFRARETYVVHGPDEFEEIFEIAAPDRPFELYSRTRLRRIG
jgi:hypothetical protein